LTSDNLYRIINSLMRAEKVVLSFVAVLIGLVAAGTAFYFYQSTKTIPNPKTEPIEVVENQTPEPLSDENHLLKIDDPQDEAVFENRQITVSGRTIPGATIIVSTEDGDEVIEPADNGDFDLTITIPSGTSILQFAAIFPDGTEKREIRTVTFSTEDF
jgi:hypothetical protein